MAIDLEVGEQVSVPPENTKRLVLDTSGDPVLVLPDGTTEALGGGGGGVDVLSDWAAEQIALLAVQAPALTSVRVLPNVGGLPLPTNGVTGGLQGGSWSAGNAVISLLSLGMLLTPKTTPFAYAFRGKFGAPTAARTSSSGMTNAAATHLFAVGTAQAESATKFVLRVVGGVTTSSPTTANADTSLHNFVVISDAVNLRLFIDGADSGATLAASLLFGDEPYIPYIFNTISLDTNVVHALVAW